MKVMIPNGSIEIGDDAVREYARTNLNMKTLDDDIEKLVEARVEKELNTLIEDDADELMSRIPEEEFREYAIRNYDMMDAEDFASDWREYVDDMEVEDYAREQFNMMTEDEAIEFAKEKLDN